MGEDDKIIILEDDLNRMHKFQAKFQGAFSYHECVETFIEDLAKNGKQYETIFLDHDLGGEQMVDHRDTSTGAEAVRIFAETDWVDKKTQIIIHSLNPAGSNYMLSYLKMNGFVNVTRIPFHELIQLW